MLNPEKSLKISHFGDYTFEHEGGILWKGKEQIHLRPLAARLLAILLETPDTVIPRERLRQEIWGNQVVEWEIGLHRLVRELRRALQEDAKSPRHLHTMHRKGYRICTAAVSSGVTQEPVMDSVMSRTKWFVAGMLVVPVAFLTICLYAGVAA